jgi:hypothetical protein
VGCAVVIDEAHRRGAPWRVTAACAEVGKTLAMRHGNRQPAAGHAGEEQAGAGQHLHQRQPRLELLAAVARETRPGLRAGDQRRQRGQHLAAVAHAQRQRVGRLKKAANCLGQRRVEQHRLRAQPSPAPSVSP